MRVRRPAVSRKSVARSIRIVTLVGPCLLGLLQWTIGESSTLIYLTMSLPPILWTIPNLISLPLDLIRKRWTLALANLAILIGGLFVFDGLCLGQPNRWSGSRLRVMTLNVEKFSNHSPLAVAKLILAQNPDIVCLQEAGTLPNLRSVPNEFKKALGGYRIVQSGETAIATKLPVGFEILFPLRGGDGGRPAQVMTVWFRNRPISIVNIHLQYFPWDSMLEANDASNHFMKECATLRDLVASKGVPNIVAGDMNSLPQGRVHRMFRRYLTDCFAATSSGFGWTIPAGFPLRRLDYIYAGDGLRPLRSWVPEGITSDHRAVVVELALEN